MPLNSSEGLEKMNLRSTSSSVSYLVPGSLVQPFVYHEDSEKVSIIMRQMRLGEPSLEVNLVKIASKAWSTKSTKDLTVRKHNLSLCLYLPQVLLFLDLFGELLPVDKRNCIKGNNIVASLDFWGGKLKNFRLLWSTFVRMLPLPL